MLEHLEGNQILESGEEGIGFPAVYVEWEDHYCKEGWRNRGQYVSEKEEDLTCYTVGFRIKETKEHVYVAQNLSHSGVDNVMVIMKNCLVKYYELTF